MEIIVGIVTEINLDDICKITSHSTYRKVKHGDSNGIYRNADIEA